MRMVQCRKLGRKLPGLKAPPMKGELGQRLYESVSDDAWKMWLQYATRLMNEYRLNPTDPEHQKVLREQLEQFFFGKER